MIHVQAHTKIENGKILWIPAYDRKGTAAQHDLGGEFDKLVGDMGITATPKPKPAEPQAWTPTKANQTDSQILINDEPGHDKIYKVTVLKQPNGKYAVVAQWGKFGSFNLAQQVKGQDMGVNAALDLMHQLVVSKKVGGYSNLSEHAKKHESWSAYHSVPISSFSVGGEGTEAPAPAPKPPAVAPKAPASLDADFEALATEIGIEGPKEKAQVPAPAQSRTESPLTKKGAKMAVAYYSDGPSGAMVSMKMAGMTPQLRVKFSADSLGASAAVKELIGMGAKFMPIAKCWAIDLNGLPWAGGKKQAQSVHNILSKNMGFMGGTGEGPAPVAKPQVVSVNVLTAAWHAIGIKDKIELANGISIGKGSAGGNPTIRVYKEGLPQSAISSLSSLGFKSHSTGGYFYKSVKANDKSAIAQVAGAMATLQFEGAAVKAPAGTPEQTLKVGSVKFENGKKYVLNTNHKWELVEMTIPVPIPAPPKPKLPEGFPFKQVGPQAGSNPGGLYEDAYGKKWYIKFPPTEEHAANENLAAKLYGLAGIAATKTKLVKKDGKVGIASAYVEGLKIEPSNAKLGKAPGAAEGFGMDAWLANWDVVGMTNDNLKLDSAGNAVRVDPGGALNFRAQGTAKGAAFGNTVTELHTFMDPGTNDKSAATFGGLSKAQISKSMVPVLEMPDDIIQAAVMKFGPGTDSEKQALADKLVARKKYLAAMFPEAELEANPPKPDPTKLQVDASKLPKLPDFHNWQGGGKGLSGTAAVNDANKVSVDAIYACAMKGDLVALKALKLAVVDKTTGQTEMKPADQHPSGHVGAFWGETVQYMEVLANPGGKLKTYNLGGDFGSSQELSDAFPSKPWGINPSNCNPHENLGYFMALGAVSDTDSLRPPNAGQVVSSADMSKAQKAHALWPATLQKYISAVQSSGNINHAFKGNEITYGSVNLKEALTQAYEHAMPKPVGTTINRWMDVPPTMYKQLQDAPVGLVFQNTDSMCASKAAGWGNHPHFDGSSSHGLLLQIHYAEGAKAMDSYTTGGYSSEEEITTLPGQRFVVLSKGTVGGKMKLELLMLPPDPTFLESVTAKKGAAA